MKYKEMEKISDCYFKNDECIYELKYENEIYNIYDQKGEVLDSSRNYDNIYKVFLQLI